MPCFPSAAGGHRGVRGVVPRGKGLVARPMAKGAIVSGALPGDRQVVYPVRDAVVLELDLVDAGGQAQGGDAAEERAVYHLQLDPRELLADALVQAEAERMVGRGRPPQVENVRVGED